LSDATPAAAPRAQGVLSGDELGAITRWEQPAMEGGGQLLTARQLESLQQQAFDEAHAAGYAAGRTEARAQVERFETLMKSLARPLEDLDASVERELVALAVSVAKMLVRRELRTDPGEIVAVVRDALALLPVGVRDVRLHLHPEDAALVRALASSAESQPMWRIVEDPTLTRGGCRVESESSQIDARLETRIGAVVSRLLGGERSEDARA
jgi:flagellar assembly protein FliH